MNTQLQIHQAALSIQLIRMRNNNLLISQRKGTKIYYALASNRMPLLANLFGLL